MLRVGLTGGIGSGKSTVAQRFAGLGALVVDADQLAREVVVAGSPGLAAVCERFGGQVVSPDGLLDRGALGQIVFADPAARRDLEDITHPLIAARTRAVVAAAAPGRVVVHDVPLLVELDLAADYHLTVVVAAEQDIRVARLAGGRGLGAADARARIGAQAGEAARRAAADVWLDNNGTAAALLARVDALWAGRIVGFNDNLLTGSSSHRPDTPTVVAYDDSWPAAAARLIARITRALAGQAVAVEHIGSTAVPGLAAKDVIDLQIGVPALGQADTPAFITALADKGFPRSQAHGADIVYPWAPHPSSWAKRLHGNADPGRVAHLHVREHGSPGWQLSLLLRDWLIANPAERDDYGALKAALARSQATTSGYTAAKEPWIAGAADRARAWARHTRWRAG